MKYGSDVLTAVLVPGGAVLSDQSGAVRLGLYDRGLDALGPDSPDHLQLAAAHLAALHAARQGLLPELPAVQSHRESRPGSGAAPDDIGCANGPANLGLRVGEPTPEGADAGTTGVAGCESAEWHEGPAVVACGSFLDGELRRVALELRGRGRDVVPVVAQKSATFIGPLLRAGASPCVLCVQRAIEPNRRMETILPPPPPAAWRLEAARQVALEWWERLETCAEAVIIELDENAAEAARHPVRRFPDCPACGDAVRDPNAGPPAVGLGPAPGERTIASTEALLARLQHLVSPLTGAVRHVRDLDTGARDLIHVCTAGHAVQSRSVSLGALMQDVRDHSGGKGATAVQARVGALCEALERVSSVFRGHEVDSIGPLLEVERALDPSILMLFSQRQYSERAPGPAGAVRGFQRVPEPFDPTAEVAWSRVWSLISGRASFVPTAFLYTGFSGPDARYCRADSNGLAAGRTLDEAILNGFLELVERDAVALWWYNRTRQPGVDARSFGDEYVRRVFEHYATIGRRAWILDLTSDLDIPVYAALSARDEGLPEVIFGFGAHIDPAIALRRSVVEMNQLLVTARRPVEERRQQLGGVFDDALDWWATATLQDHPYLLPASGPTPSCVYSHGKGPGGDIRDATRTCLGIAARHNLDVYVRDMTRPDIGLPVVKVLVPGLRHFWRRLAPGRLYDVPVRTGRLTAPRDESEMNPVSLFV